MQIAEAFVKIRADTNQFPQDLRGIESGVTDAGTRAGRATAAALKGQISEVDKAAQSSARNVAATFAQFLGAGIFISKMKGAVDAASDLNETISKTKQIFGETTDAVVKTAETSAKSMGLSKRAYLDAAAGLKGLLDNMGLAADESTRWSQDMTGLGADLASFFNTDPADAIYAISAALRGESEPIRRYNVQLNDAALKSKAFELGLYDGKGALEANAKAQAALALIMDQTTAAQGDFARTADGVANQQRINKALAEDSASSFGQVLLPVYQRVLQVLGFLSEGFGSLPAPVQIAFVALAGFVALSGPMGTLADVMKTATSAISGLATTTKVSLGVVGLLIGLAGTLYTIFSDGDDKTKDLTAGTDALVDALKQSTTQLLDNLDAVKLVKGELPDTTAGFTALSTAVVNALNAEKSGSGDRLVKLLGEMGLTAQDAASAMAAVTIRVRDSNGRVGDLAAAVKGLTVEQVNWASKTRAATYEQELAAEGMTEAEANARGYTREVFNQRDALAKITAGTNDLAAAMRDSNVDVEAMAQGFLDQARGASELTKGLVEQAEAQAASTGNTGDAVTVYLDYIAVTSGLSDEQKKLALDLDAAAAANAQAADATDDKTASDEAAKQAVEANKAATKDLNDALSDSTNEFKRVAAAANVMRQAIDDVFGSSLDLEHATRALYDATTAQEAAFKTNGVTLDIATEAGRANRKAVEDQVNAILDYGVAMVGAGDSNEDAANAVNGLTGMLKEQLRQAGFTEDQINDYLDTLGLTPENVTTTINLANDEATKARLEDLLKQLDTIDAGAAAEVQALIDEGSFAAAEYRLKLLTGERRVLITPRVGGGTTQSAWGNYFDRPSFTSIAEDGDPEAVLTLGKPANLARQVRDPRIGGPIMEALGMKRSRLSELLSGPEAAPASDGPGQTSAGGRSVVRTGPAVNIEHVHLASGLDAEVLGRTASFLMAGTGVGT